MKKPNRKLLTTITLFFILIISAILVTLPATTAQGIDFTKHTYAFIGAVPNPVGVNQEVLLHVGITDMLGIETDGWEGLTVTVERPDGQTETLGPFRTDSTGGTGAVYVPTMVGTYKLQTNFPGQVYFWSSFPVFIPEFFLKTVSYLSSNSEVLELVVQEDPIQFYQGAPLPGEYWSRPIDAQHREWNTISANWIERPPNLHAPFNDNAPETAHVLWTKPITIGGLAGGELGVQGMECGDAYEGKFQDSIIINGILFYNRFAETFTGPMTPQKGVFAVDLRTGEELWFKNNTKIDFGQTFYFDQFNYHGVFSYLWETTTLYFPGAPERWDAYDPYTGEWVYSMDMVPSGPTFRGPHGEILRYIVDLENGWMALWNSTDVLMHGHDSSFQGSWGRNVYGKTLNGMDGIFWNVTIPSDLPGEVHYGLEDRIIGSNATGYWAPNVGDRPITMWGISTEPVDAGELLFKTTWQPPLGDRGIGTRDITASVEDGIFCMYCKETRQVFVFDIDTGAELWRTEELPYMAQYYVETHIVNGKLIVDTNYAGVINAYDVESGDLLWSYEVVDPKSEILWSKNWPVKTLFITDGKIYIGQTEHSPIDPKPRGAPFLAIDIETGEEVFKVEGMFRQTDWGGMGIIGDSIIATMDTYDQRIYAIGKGPSEITVDVAPKISDWGSSVLLEGTVMDISAGTEDPHIKARFPAGVPAVADEYMSDWMKYVYKQFPPPMVMGVEVRLEVVVDPNGNWYDIGTVRTDSTGYYSIMWEPPVPGHYQILATFAGSDAYWGSYKMTAIGVDQGLTPGSLMESDLLTATGSDQIAQVPLISNEIAILASVAIFSLIGLAALSFLRKQE